MRRLACKEQESDFGSRSIWRRTLRKSLAPTMALQIDAVQQQVRVRLSPSEAEHNGGETVLF